MIRYALDYHLAAIQYCISDYLSPIATSRNVIQNVMFLTEPS